MKVAIIFFQFFSPDGMCRKIGGVETYIEYLSYLCIKQGHEPIIYQKGDSDWDKMYNGIKIVGIKAKSVKKIYHKVIEDVDVKKDLVIFASDFFSVDVKKVKGNIMSIQHGIWWDIPKCQDNKLLSFCVRVRDILIALKTYNHTRYRVCVDYNFYNWFKTILPFRIPRNIKVIPNFTQCIISADELDKKMKRLSSGRVNLIFARRFVEYRGALLFAEAISEVLYRHPELYVTIAGEGPCEGQMRDILSANTRVKYIKYDPKDTCNVHYANDIAVIPTIASEGTSLSLIEAMGAGCLVVSTPVGGMSNIIIDGFNGLITMPDKTSLIDTLEKAILEVENKKYRNNAIETVREAFSLEKWEKEWIEVLNKFS